MAAADFRLIEDLFQCSICLDVFKDPVSTPCGHNFCKNCITEHLNIDVPLQCPICRRMFYPKPELQINTLITEMIDVFRQNRPTVVRCAACSKIKQIGQFFCRIGTVCIFLVFSYIVYYIFLRDVCGGRNLEKPDKKIQEQIQEIAQKIQGLIPLVELCGKDVQNEGVMETQKSLREGEQVKVQHHSIEVTFDPDTAYPGLILSADGKQVRCCDSSRNLPQNPKRFTEFAFVLGKQGFSSGRFYFEVQVKGKTKWSIGVAKESVSRKGDIKLRPQNGFWTLCMKSRGEYRALAGPSVSLHLRSAFEKVGVFVDYEAGLVSFYDVNYAAHIYSFTGCHFTERLFPFFDPSLNNDGQNYAPLII